MPCGDASLAGDPEVSQVLQSLLQGVQAALGARCVGLYLSGSLASGGFDPRTSDIDFLVVTADELTPADIDTLNELHARLLADGSHWAGELEGSYIPRRDIRRYDPQRATHPHLERGSQRLAVEQHDTDWVVHRQVLWEHGVALYGPPPRELIDPVTPAELRQALQELMRGWWAPMADDPARLRDLAYRCYAVQTMCRMLYTLQCGGIATKPAATQWASTTLEHRWTPLIEWSLKLPRIEQPGTLEQTRELIRYVSGCYVNAN